MTKLEVLKNYLQYVLDHELDHNWSTIDSCHCGMLLKSLNLDTSSVIDTELDKVIQREDYPGWYKFLFNFYKSPTCNITELPFTQVLDELVSYGFTLDELANLEHLQDKRFIDLDLHSHRVEYVSSLIEYLTNWIKYEEQMVQATTKEQVPVKVSVS